MEEICKEEYYIEAFDTLMQAFDKNDIAFGNGKFWAVNMVRQACIIADVDSHIRFGQWISVNDRLPDETGFYFVYAPSYRCGSSSGIRSYDGMMVTKFMNGKRWGAEIQSYNKKCVTHWMPLPEAPKEYEKPMDTYKAKSISTGKEVKGELAYDGLSCFIIEKWPYGTSTVRVDPNTIEKVESDADTEGGPRYAGDDAFVELNGRSIQANCYETIHHEWRIQNSGRVPWHDRKLVLMNGKEIRPRPVDEVVPLPDTAPGDHIKIATDIDARGIEGNFECKWEMQDADGQNCFPNKRWDFNTTILVKFQPSDKGEKRG